MNGGERYLLDTNVVLALMRSNPLGLSIEASYGLRSAHDRGLISVVTVGEMLALAKIFGWGESRFTQLEEFVNNLIWIDINSPQILATYGELDHESKKLGRRMGKNDVWIAATARVSGLTLLTTDDDFDHLHGTWIDRIWINPQSGKTP